MEVAPSLFLEFHGSEHALSDQVKVVGEYADHGMQYIRFEWSNFAFL